MKTILYLIAVLFFSIEATAQTDSTNNKPDSIVIGNMVIIKKLGKPEGRTITLSRRTSDKPSKVSTSWWILDIGFANFDDQTNYAQSIADNYVVNRPGHPTLGESDFKLKTGKSSNVNLWLFLQKLNIAKGYVNLKYGIGVEMNNYRFKSPVSFKEAGPNPYMTSQNINHAFVFEDSIDFTKNKLAADYVTVPFMINFTSNPSNSSRGLSISAGVSVGYLYNTRNKQVSGVRGKRKNHGDYDLEKWKLSYVGELGLGPARLYGSYSPNSIFTNGLKMIPYNVGIRFSNW